MEERSVTTDTPSRRSHILPLVIAVVLSASLLITILLNPSFFYGFMTSDLKDSELFDDMQSGKSFCFLGDSITYGTETGEFPWYHHLEKYIKGDVSNLSYSGWTAGTLVAERENIPEADIYVIAIGINDAVFYDIENADIYVDNLRTLKDYLRGINPDCKFYFITPWLFYGQWEVREPRREEFTDALKAWCAEEDLICIDPQPIIREMIGENGVRIFMTTDNMHPNRMFGIGLFSRAVLEAEHRRRVQA